MIDNYTNQLDVCYKDACIKAKGKNANIITDALVVMLLLIGVGIFIKSIS